MGILGIALTFLLLIVLGAALFSVAAGFCIFPSIKKEVLKRIDAASAGPNDAKSKESLRSLRRFYSSKRINAKGGGRGVSGWLFVPVKEKESVNRILAIAPEGRAVSIKDLCAFLERGILDRARSGDTLPAVFIPKPAELCDAVSFFSFGKKQAKALVACARFLSREMPQCSLLLCGKGFGAFSAVFAAAKLARRANFGGVVAELPSSSVAAIMRSVVAGLFPQRALSLLVYAGIRFASLFCGLGIGGRNTRRALKRISSAKRECMELVVEVTS